MNKVVQQLIDKDIKIAVVESLTGGRVCNEITNVSGSSKVFNYGFVVYSDQAKIDFGVSKDTIKSSTAVSKEVALELTRALKEKTDCQLCIATTGEAGPTSAVAPVGRVFIAINNKAHQYDFEGSRKEIKQQVVDEVFRLIKEN